MSLVTEIIEKNRAENATCKCPKCEAILKEYRKLVTFLKTIKPNEQRYE